MSRKRRLEKHVESGTEVLTRVMKWCDDLFRVCGILRAVDGETGMIGERGGVLAVGECRDLFKRVVASSKWPVKYVEMLWHSNETFGDRMFSGEMVASLFPRITAELLCELERNYRIHTELLAEEVSVRAQYDMGKGIDEQIDMEHDGIVVLNLEMSAMITELSKTCNELIVLLSQVCALKRQLVRFPDAKTVERTVAMRCIEGYEFAWPGSSVTATQCLCEYDRCVEVTQENVANVGDSITHVQRIAAIAERGAEFIDNVAVVAGAAFVRQRGGTIASHVYDKRGLLESYAMEAAAIRRDIDDMRSLTQLLHGRTSCPCLHRDYCLASCGHTFCAQCIGSCVSQVPRVCPFCGHAFDEADIIEIKL